MLKELLTSSAVVLALAGPTYAGSTDSSATGQVQATQNENPDATAEQTDIPSATANPSAAAAQDDATSPDPADTSETSEEGVIAVQSEDEGRMADLIGMTVANPQDGEVGEVQDVLFKKDGNISGVVVSVGGFLGIGDKLVALPWDAVQVDHEEEIALVHTTKDQLDAAPPFKTLEQVVAEEEAASAVEMQQQQMQQNLPAQEQEQQQ